MERLKQIFTWLITWLTPKRSQDVKVVGLCLLVAATFWFLNALNRDYSTRISYPIRFNFDDSTYIATRPLPTKLRLSVTGYGWNLLKKSLSIDSEPIEYTISKPLRTKYITAPFLLTAVSEQLQGLRINYVVEDTLQMSFDRRVRKTVPLKIDSARIDLNKNYVIAEPINITPSTITFEGPASLLDKIGPAYVIPIAARDIDDDFDERLEIPNPDNALVNMDLNKAEVRFKLEALITDSRKVVVRKSHFLANKDSVNLQRTVTVTYAIRQRDALKVSANDFSIVADFKDIKAQDSTIVLFIEKQPFFIRNVSLDNPYIQVKNGQ
ncbi:MAG: hypothetical protein V4714_07510 [Bacteroidota bacterium]